ncbi:MAG TPA: hypothetical protein GX710_03250 [Clostridiales bacterium]|nr:hypothetical protein [Clostridiales bacterium]
MKKYVIIFMTTILLISCEKEDINESNIRIDKELISELNSKSHDTLIIESNKFVLDAYLWRDFMPISPSDGKPMISINWLRDIDSMEISDNIDLIEQYVVYNDSIWIANYENETSSTQPDYKIEKISRDGPKWGPKIYVDVISKVHDSITNSDYYIKSKNIYVERTD